MDLPAKRPELLATAPNMVDAEQARFVEWTVVRHTVSVRVSCFRRCASVGDSNRLVDFLLFRDLPASFLRYMYNLVVVFLYC